MTNRTRDLVLNILLVIGFVIGAFLYSFEIQSFVSTLALVFGLGNVYLTTKRNINFIYFDLLWIVFTLICLYQVDNCSDSVLFIFYIFVGFYQYFNWKRNRDVNNDGNVEVELIQFDRTNFKFVNYALLLSILIILLTPDNSSYIALGGLISGFGIVGSILLAKRYYFAEVLFVFVNLMQIYFYYVTGLYALGVIPVLFLLNTIVFLVFNRKNAI